MSNEFVMVRREVVESILQGAYTRFLTETEVDGLKTSSSETIDLMPFIAFQVDESCGDGLGDKIEIPPSNKPIAWHAGGNGYDRIYLEHPGFLDGHPAINPIHDLMHLLALLPRYDLRNESNEASAEPSGPIEIDDLRIHLEAMCKLWPEDLSDDGSGRMGFKSEVAATVAKARAALVRKP